MKLFLCSNESLVCFIIELNVSQYCADNKRSDLLDRWFYSDGKLGLGKLEFWSLDLFEVNLEGPYKGGFSE